MKNAKHIIRPLTVVMLFSLALVSCQKEEIEPTVDSEQAEAKMFTAQDIAPVPVGPDLVITSVTTTLPSVPNTTCGGPGLQAICGQQYTAQVVVTNVGSDPVTVPYSLGLAVVENGSLSALYDFNSPTSTLAPGASHTFNIPPAPYASCSGTPILRQIVFAADLYNEVAEGLEGNNRSNPLEYCGD